MNNILVADIETDGLLDTVTKIHQISIQSLDGEMESYHGRTVPDGLRRLEEADKYVFHNGIGYDLRVIKKLHPEVDLPWEKCIDTMVLSKLGNPERKGFRPHSLESWGERLGVAKVEHTEWETWTPAMEDRCNGDVKITKLLYERLKGMLEVMPEAVSIEHAVAHEVALIKEVGFHLNVPYTLALLNQLMSANEERKVELTKLFPPILIPVSPSHEPKVLKVVNKNHPLRGSLDPGSPFSPVVVQEFNPGSRQQIASRLISRYGWKPTQWTPSGQPEISEDVLQDLKYPEAKALAVYLDEEKKIGQINSKIKKDGFGGGWLHHVTPAGRVHANLNPCKAVTGRPSCSSPNLQQVDTDEAMRMAWDAGKGWVLVGVDADGLELRCLAHYLHRHDGGAYGKMLVEGDKSKGTDVHSVVRDLWGFHSVSRTKNAEYGWLFGAGDARMGAICMQDAYENDAEIQWDVLGVKKGAAASTIGKAMRSKIETGIVGLGDLIKDIRGRAAAKGKLRGLDGRTLWVRSPHSALNLLLQSAGIIIIKKSMQIAPAAMQDAGLVYGSDQRVVMWIHDELQYEARPEAAQLVGQTFAGCIPAAGEALGFKCPVSGTYQIGNNWSETH